MESRSGKTERVCEAVSAAKGQSSASGRAPDAALLRGCLPSALGVGSGLFLLVAGRAALAGWHGQWPEAAEHPGGLLARRPRVLGSAADTGQHQWRTVC